MESVNPLTWTHLHLHCNVLDAQLRGVDARNVDQRISAIHQAVEGLRSELDRMPETASHRIVVGFMPRGQASKVALQTLLPHLREHLDQTRTRVERFEQNDVTVKLLAELELVEVAVEQIEGLMRPAAAPIVEASEVEAGPEVDESEVADHVQPVAAELPAVVPRRPTLKSVALCLRDIFIGIPVQIVRGIVFAVAWGGFAVGKIVLDGANLNPLRFLAAVIPPLLGAIGLTAVMAVATVVKHIPFEMMRAIGGLFVPKLWLRSEVSKETGQPELKTRWRRTTDWEHQAWAKFDNWARHTWIAAVKKL